jgi:hypothetical protein
MRVQNISCGELDVIMIITICTIWKVQMLKLGLCLSGAIWINFPFGMVVLAVLTINIALFGSDLTLYQAKQMEEILCVRGAMMALISALLNQY